MLGGCLSPGAPLYDKQDSVHPKLVSVAPPMGGGTPPSIEPLKIIVITFSEAMDLESLRPGIVVRDKDRKEQPLTIRVDPAEVRPLSAADPDIPFPVQVSSALPGGFAPGAYQLALRTLLIDQQGNTILDGEDPGDAGIRDIDFLGAFNVVP
jgi:hypothetical protein